MGFPKEPQSLAVETPEKALRGSNASFKRPYANGPVPGPTGRQTTKASPVKLDPYVQLASSAWQSKLKATQQSPRFI